MTDEDSAYPSITRIADAAQQKLELLVDTDARHIALYQRVDLSASSWT